MNLFQQAIYSGRAQQPKNNAAMTGDDIRNTMCERGIAGVKAGSMIHSGKWKNHKYLYKEGDRYIYPEDVQKGNTSNKFQKAIASEKANGNFKPIHPKEDQNKTKTRNHSALELLNPRLAGISRAADTINAHVNSKDKETKNDDLPKGWKRDANGVVYDEMGAIVSAKELERLKKKKKKLVAGTN